MNRLNIDVESIEIKFPSNKFNLGFTLQDTPGVDSNVSTHQSTTEQFLYTSNMIVYIVDYNHVQSAQFPIYETHESSRHTYYFCYQSN